MTNIRRMSQSAGFRGRSAHRVVLICYVAILTLIVSFPQGFESIKFGVRLDAPPNQMRETFGLSDAGSYLGAAIQLVDDGYLDPGNYWILNLWPPGMVLLDSALLRFVSGELPFGVALMCVTALVWLVLLAVVALLVESRWGVFQAFLFVSLVYLMSPLPGWILGYGLFYADGIGAAFFVGFLLWVSVGLHFRAVPRVWISSAIFAGVFLAVAAYFRASYFPIYYVLIAMGVFLGLVSAVGNYRRRTDLKLVDFAPALVLLLAWLVMFTLTTPWLEFTQGKLRDSREWSVVAGGFIQGSWAQREDAPTFLQGVGWACEINPVRCSEIRQLEIEKGGPLDTEFYAREMVETALSRPVAFATDRSRFIVDAWVMRDDNNARFGEAQGFILLILFLWTQVLALRLVKSGSVTYLLWVLMPIILVLPSIIGHFEVRYLLPVKLMFLSAPALALQLRKPRGLRVKASSSNIDASGCGVVAAREENHSS